MATVKSSGPEAWSTPTVILGSMVCAFVGMTIRRRSVTIERTLVTNRFISQESIKENIEDLYIFER